MRWWRLSLGVCGLAATTYGAVVMGESGLTNIIRTTFWLVGGVLAHDALLAPATIVIVVVATRVLPAWARGAAAVGMLVLGSLTLLAIPVLGRFGARSDNPSLLDRDYTAGWLVVAVGTVVVVAASAAVRRRTWVVDDSSTGEGSARQDGES